MEVIEILRGEVNRPEYAGLSNDEIADRLNARTQTKIVSRFVNYRTMLAELWPETTLTIKAKIEAASAASPLLGLVNDMLKPEAGGIDIGHPATRQQIQQFVAGGLFTDDEAQAMLALAEVPYSRGEELGLPSIAEVDVAAVRESA